MLRILALLATMLALPALADDKPLLTGPIEPALKTPGLVVFEITKEGWCKKEKDVEDGFDDPRTIPWLMKFNAHAMIVDRKKRMDDVPLLVKGGREVLPMRIAYLDGTEVDRTCGCQTSPELQAWMTGLLQGRTLADAKRAELGDPADGFDINDELEVTRLHYCANRHMDGFEALKVLWELIPEQQPQLREIRLTRLAHDMGVLARHSEEVTAQIRKMRDGLKIARDDTYEGAADWVALNRILLEDDKTLKWFEAAKDDPERMHLARNQSANVYFIYLERGDWAAAGGVIDDHEVWLDRWKKMPGGAERAAEGYAAMVAAGSKDAAKLAKAILKADDKAACTLISKVVEAGAAAKNQKGIAKGCDDPAVVGAWEAALP